MIITMEPLPQPLSFVYHLVYPLMYLFLCTCMFTYGGAHIHSGGQDTVFRSWCITSTLWSQAIRLGSKGLYWRLHLRGPKVICFSDRKTKASAAEWESQCHDFSRLHSTTGLPLTQS